MVTFHSFVALPGRAMAMLHYDELLGPSSKWALKWALNSTQQKP